MSVSFSLDARIDQILPNFLATLHDDSAKKAELQQPLLIEKIEAAAKAVFDIVVKMTKEDAATQSQKQSNCNYSFIIHASEALTEVFCDFMSENYHFEKPRFTETNLPLIYFKVFRLTSYKSKIESYFRVCLIWRHSHPFLSHYYTKDSSDYYLGIQAKISSSNLAEIFWRDTQQKSMTNVIIQTLDDKEFHAHNSVLNLSSTLFKTMLKGSFIEAKHSIIKMDTDYRACKAFIEGIYLGKFTMENQDDLDLIFEVHRLSHRFEIENIKKLCEEILLQYYKLHKLDLSEEQFTNFFLLGITYNFQELILECLRWIEYHKKGTGDYLILDKNNVSQISKLAADNKFGAIQKIIHLWRLFEAK